MATEKFIYGKHKQEGKINRRTFFKSMTTGAVGLLGLDLLKGKPKEVQLNEEVVGELVEIIGRVSTASLGRDLFLLDLINQTRAKLGLDPIYPNENQTPSSPSPQEKPQEEKANKLFSFNPKVLSQTVWEKETKQNI